MFSIYRNQTALSSLQETWLNGTDTLRDAIVRASERLDHKLQTDPQEQGESRHDRTRILFDSPVAVLFEVDEERKLVRICKAWAFRQRSDYPECAD